MSKVKALMLGLLAALLMTLAACDTATAPEDSAPIDVEAPGDANDFWETCEEFTQFGGQNGDRNGIRYRYDDQGRSFQATLSPVKGGGRGGNRLTNGCQSFVGNLFGPGSQPSYAGGHLIADSLGGWGGRVNLAPQATLLNASGGKWAKMEAAARKCRERNNIAMTVTVNYGGNNNSIPESWTVAFTKMDTNKGVNETFANDDNGSGGNLNNLTGWLSDNGCTTKRGRP